MRDFSRSETRLPLIFIRATWHLIWFYIIVNAIVLMVPAKGAMGHLVGNPIGHPVGHRQGWPLYPWTLDLSIVGSNPMSDTVLTFFTF